MTEPIRVTEVRGRRDRRRFLDLPRSIYGTDPNWVPQLRHEVRGIMSLRRNPFFEHGEAAFWLAWRGGKPVGRISAQVNRLHLETHKDATGHFGFLEAIDDPAVFQALLATAEAWLAARGLARIRGPHNLSINDEIGVLVEGFDRPPVVGMAYSPRYYAPRLEEAGYAKAKDVKALYFRMYGPENREIDRLERVADRVRTDRRLRVREIDMRRFGAEMRVAIDVYNDAWSGNWGFVPVTEREVRHLAAMVRPIIRPDYVLMGEVDGHLDGIFIAIPNLNEAIADLGGRLIPFGWAKLLWRLKRRPFKSARVILAGTRRKYQNSLLSAGLMSWMLSDIIQAGRAAGLDWVELSWVLEDNAASMALCQRAGGRVYKTYRIYERALGAPSAELEAGSAQKTRQTPGG